MRTPITCTGWAALLLLLAPGCGAQGPELTPVTGTVTYRGEPVEGATVMFVPEGAPSASAQTEAGGRFELRTSMPGDGAAVGEHKVSIVKFEKQQDNPDPYAIGKPVLPNRYSNPFTSDLTATVVDGQKNDFRFDLTD